MHGTTKVFLASCALLLAGAPLRAQKQSRPPKSSSTLITAEEIDRSRPNVGNALDAVKSLRPRWLRVREIVQLPGAGTDMQMTQIRVYMDDRDIGNLEMLGSFPAEQVYTLRYLSTNEAGARFGPSAGPGIVVTLKP